MTEYVELEEGDIVQFGDEVNKGGKWGKVANIGYSPKYSQVRRFKDPNVVSKVPDGYVIRQTYKETLRKGDHYLDDYGNPFVAQKNSNDRYWILIKKPTIPKGFKLKYPFKATAKAGEYRLSNEKARKIEVHHANCWVLEKENSQEDSQNEEYHELSPFEPLEIGDEILKNGTWEPINSIIRASASERYRRLNDPEKRLNVPKGYKLVGQERRKVKVGEWFISESLYRGEPLEAAITYLDNNWVIEKIKSEEDTDTEEISKGAISINSCRKLTKEKPIKERTMIKRILFWFMRNIPVFMMGMATPPAALMYMGSIETPMVPITLFERVTVESVETPKPDSPFREIFNLSNGESYVISEEAESDLYGRTKEVRYLKDKNTGKSAPQDIIDLCNEYEKYVDDIEIYPMAVEPERWFFSPSINFREN